MSNLRRDHWCSRLAPKKLLSKRSMNYHWNVVGNSRVVLCGCMRTMRINGRIIFPNHQKGKDKHKLARHRWNIRDVSELKIN